MKTKLVFASLCLLMLGMSRVASAQACVGLDCAPEGDYTYLYASFASDDDLEPIDTSWADAYRLLPPVEVIGTAASTISAAIFTGVGTEQLNLSLIETAAVALSWTNKAMTAIKTALQSAKLTAATRVALQAALQSLETASSGLAVYGETGSNLIRVGIALNQASVALSSAVAEGALSSSVFAGFASVALLSTIAGVGAAATGGYLAGTVVYNQNPTGFSDAMEWLLTGGQGLYDPNTNSSTNLVSAVYDSQGTITLSFTSTLYPGSLLTAYLPINAPTALTAYQVVDVDCAADIEKTSCPMAGGGLTACLNEPGKYESVSNACRAGLVNFFVNVSGQSLATTMSTYANVFPAATESLYSPSLVAVDEACMYELIHEAGVPLAGQGLTAWLNAEDRSVSQACLLGLEKYFNESAAQLHASYANL